MIERRQGGGGKEPIHVDERHPAARVLLQCGIHFRTVIERVRIDYLHPAPRVVDIPLITPQIDVKDGFLQINRLRFHNLSSPRKTVNQFGECAAISIKCLRCFASVIEMRERKIACKGPVKRVKRIYMLPNRGEHRVRRNEVPLRGRDLPVGRTFFNPAANRVNSGF